MIIPSGSKCIDSLLGGGVETGTITQIYGESGTGKTALCLMLSKNAAKMSKAAYIDTEGISGERIAQIFGNDKDLLESIFIYEVYDFKQQSVAVKNLSKLCKQEEKVKLVVVDSFTGLYRSELEEGKIVKIKRELIKQLTFLLGIARKYDIAIVITNQMFSDVNRGIELPIGGPSINHLSKVVLELKLITDINRFEVNEFDCNKSKGDYINTSDHIRDNIIKSRYRRIAKLVKHRWLAEGKVCEYYITNSGIEP